VINTLIVLVMLDRTSQEKESRKEP